MTTKPRQAPAVPKVSVASWFILMLKQEKNIQQVLLPEKVHDVFNIRLARLNENREIEHQLFDSDRFASTSHKYSGFF